MGITLYTSRVVLNVLGVDNYGIYNLVGGVVVLFSFLSAAMTTATQRFLCVSIGVGNKKQIQSLFSSAIVSHILLICLLFILAETVGFWFISSELNVPSDRYGAVLCVYQLSILSTAFSVYRIPFNAAILSYERMSFYAYSGIIEVLLKLFILLPLYYVPGDKLILYGGLVCFVNFIILIWSIWYTNYKLEAVKHRIRGYKIVEVKKVFNFAGWSSLSALANIGSRQGLNIIINIFYGVAQNAAIGIMNQVSSAVYMFIGNFQSAINPPLMKGYTKKEIEYTRNLFIVSSKFSCSLFIILITPVIFNISPILNIWLKIVPPETDWFCVLALISLIPNTIGGPIWVIMQSKGEIKKYQIFISSILILNIPFYYFILKLGLPAPLTVAIQFVTNTIVTFVGASMCLNKIQLNCISLVKEVIMPNVTSTAIAWGGIYLIDYYDIISIHHEILDLVVRIFVDIALIIMSVYLLGMNKHNREFLKKIVVNKIKKK